MPTIKTLKSVDNGRYISVMEAAHQLGVQSATVRTYLWLGRLTTFKFKTMTLLDVGEVKQYKEKLHAGNDSS